MYVFTFLLLLFGWLAMVLFRIQEIHVAFISLAIIGLLLFCNGHFYLVRAYSNFAISYVYEV